MTISMVLKDTRGYTKADLLSVMGYAHIQYSYYLLQPPVHYLGLPGLRYFEDMVENMANDKS